MYWDSVGNCKISIFCKSQQSWIYFDMYLYLYISFYQKSMPFFIEWRIIPKPYTTLIISSVIFGLYFEIDAYIRNIGLST